MIDWYPCLVISLLFLGSIPSTVQFLVILPIPSSFRFIRSQDNRYNTQDQMMSNTWNRGPSASPLSSSTRSMDDRGMSRSASTSKNVSTKKEPIYITIGPQCAGKTTLLSKILHQSSSELNETVENVQEATPAVLDVAIDDQRGVYLKIPVELFVASSTSINSGGGGGGAIEESSILYSKHSNLLQYELHNKTISERIYDPCNDEMRYITQRLCNKLTRQDFEDKLMALYANYSSIQSIWQKVLSRDLAHGAINDVEYQSQGDLIACLVEVVEELNMTFNSDEKSDGSFPVSHVDLYVPECIFKELPSDDPLLLFPLDDQKDVQEVESVIHKQWFDYVRGRPMSGLAAAKSKLGFLAENKEFQSMPLAWGNTNTKARDYSAALDVAAISGRPVHFLPYMNPNHLNVDCESSVHHCVLPRVGLKTLIQRNIHRYMNTGRFIPTRAIIETCQRVDELMEDALEEMKKKKTSHNETLVMMETEKRSCTEEVSFSKFELDCAMAGLASFGMKEDRTVYRLPRDNWNNGRGNNNNYYNNNNSNNRISSEWRPRYSDERYLRYHTAGRGERYHGDNSTGRGRVYQDNLGRGQYSQRSGEGRQGRGYKRHHQEDDDRRDDRHRVGGRPRYDRTINLPYGQDPRTSGRRDEESARFGGSRGNFNPNRDGRGRGRGGTTRH